MLFPQVFSSYIYVEKAAETMFVQKFVRKMLTKLTHRYNRASQYFYNISLTNTLGDGLNNNPNICLNSVWPFNLLLSVIGHSFSLTLLQRFSTFLLAHHWSNFSYRLGLIPSTCFWGSPTCVNSLALNFYFTNITTPNFTRKLKCKILPTFML